jgi:hypothetical protein
MKSGFEYINIPLGGTGGEALTGFALLGCLRESALRRELSITATVAFGEARAGVI